MTPTVHILATCRDEAGLNAATLVFQTLRVGFPTAKVELTINTPNWKLAHEIEKTFQDAGGNALCWFTKDSAHADWIRKLVAVREHPFWICDTDVVFHESVEELTSDAALLGRYQPLFQDPATGCCTMQRLHTSLLRINPAKFREDVAAYESGIRLKRFAPPADYWAPIVLPVMGRSRMPYFFDCGAVAFAAVGGMAFGDDANARFDHLHNATYLDEIAPLLPDADLKAWHAQVYANPALLRGAYARQMEWFARHA